MESRDKIEKLRRQQSAVADFGSFAFREEDLQTILMEAARVCAVGLAVPFAMICEYRPEHNDLFVVAGWGWKDGVIGRVVSAADDTTTQGRAFTRGEPIILADITKNNSYTLPEFCADHGIISTADVVIQSQTRPWGVLEVDSGEVREFDQQDIVFLTGFANILAEAVERREQISLMRKTIGEMAQLIVEKDTLLEQHIADVKILREMQAELLHVSRLDTVGQMTAAITHELNQPLAAIANYIGAAKLTLDTLPADTVALGEIQQMIGNAEAQTLRAAGVMKGLKNLIEKRESIRTSESLESVVREAMGIVMFGPAATNVVVNLAVATDLSPVMIDRIQVQQILFNLIRNSIEAMLPMKTRTLRVTLNRGQSDFAEVTIADSGPGLPKNVRERLFQAFVTTKSEGMGLGLMVCRTLAEANGGRIWCADSTPDGTVFVFSLPFAAVAALDLPLVA